MPYEQITVEQSGPILRVFHNRPDARNAESQQLLTEMDAALAAAANDDSVRVVIIGGHGDHFSAGHDLKEAQQKRVNFTVEQRHRYETDHYLGHCLRLWDFPKPTIAQVQGACIAGGYMLANMCDLVVASDEAFFQDSVLHGLSLAAVEVLFHPWVLGIRKAKEVLYTGRRVTATEAFDLGMVNLVVPRAELHARTDEMALRIAEAPPFALQMLKRSLNRTADLQGFRASIEAHFDTHQLTHHTAERQRVKERGLMSAARDKNR